MNMTTLYNSIEAKIELEFLATKRAARLESIALKEMMREDRDIDKMCCLELVAQLSHDNIITDYEITRHFSQGVLPF